MQITFTRPPSPAFRACIHRAVAALEAASLLPSDEVCVEISYIPEAQEARARTNNRSTLIWNDDGSHTEIAPADGPAATYSIVLTDESDLYTALHELCHVVDWSSEWDPANTEVNVRRQEILAAARDTDLYRQISAVGVLDDKDLAAHISDTDVARFQKTIHPLINSPEAIRELARVKAADFELFVHALAQYCAHKSPDTHLQAGFEARSAKAGYAVPLAWDPADFESVERLITMRLLLADRSIPAAVSSDLTAGLPQSHDRFI